MSAIMIPTHYIKAQMKGKIFRTRVALDAGWKALTFLKQKKTHMESCCRAISLPTLCNYIRKAHQDGKEKEMFGLFPFSISLTGLLWLGGGTLNGSDCALASSASVFWLFWCLLLVTNAATADLLTQRFKIG